MYNTLAVVFFACKEKYFFFICKKTQVKKTRPSPTLLIDNIYRLRLDIRSVKQSGELNTFTSYTCNPAILQTDRSLIYSKNRSNYCISSFFYIYLTNK